MKNSRASVAMARLGAVLVILLVAFGLGAAPASAGHLAEDHPANPANPDGRPMIVEYSRIGGVAGVEDHLALRWNGWLHTDTRSGRCHQRLTTAHVLDLIDELEAADFPTLPSATDREVADAISYTVTYRGITVRAYDTAIPDALRPVLEVLDELVDRPCPGPC